MACAQFARCYGTLCESYINLRDYSYGLAHMPYQGRMLMMYPLRWAGGNEFLVRHTAWRSGSLRSPEMAMITLGVFVSLCLTCLFTTLLYLKASRRRVLPWMPAALLPGVAAVQYILHLQNVLFPYDLPSLMFFTLGVYLIYTRRVWWLVLLFPAATLNREVTLFLGILLAIDVYASDGVRGWLRPGFLSQLGSMAAIWLAVHFYVQRRFAANITEQVPRISTNLHWLRDPQYWPQLLCIGGFLLPFLFAGRRYVASPRMRAYLWIVLPWVICMFFYGVLIETRVFGELSGLIAVLATLEMEEFVLQQTLPAESSPAVT
jgi:hypothetical protein